MAEKTLQWFYFIRNNTLKIIIKCVAQLVYASWYYTLKRTTRAFLMYAASLINEPESRRTKIDEGEKSWRDFFPVNLRLWRDTSGFCCDLGV